MNIKKILAFLTAFVLTSSAYSCSLRGNNSNSEKSDISDYENDENDTEEDDEKKQDTDEEDTEENNEKKQDTDEEDTEENNEKKQDDDNEVKEKPKKYRKVSDNNKEKDKPKKYRKDSNNDSNIISDAANKPINDSGGLDVIREHVRTLLDDLDIISNEAALRDDIATLLADYDALYEAKTLHMIKYYLDMENKELENNADDAYEELNIAYDLITHAFCKGYYNNVYKELFIDLIPDVEISNTYSGSSFTMESIEENSRKKSKIIDECIDRYHDISYDEYMDDDEKNLKCAEILLDILRNYDTDTFYTQYCRDYTPDDIIALTDIVHEKMVPVSDEIMDSIISMDSGIDILLDPVEFDDPFETIAKCASELSPEIEAAASKLLEDKEYSITNGDGSYTGSFTSYLPVSKKGIIYVTDEHNYHSLLTPIHEFGHYYAMTYNDVPTYLAASNLDIAEIQSQGLECIFTRFYDEIYGEQSEAMLATNTYDLVYSVITGFSVGEFEYTVLENIDTLTPEDVVGLWNEIVGESLESELYMVNHIYEAPGYYISYAVSALASFDIWKDCLDNPDKALEKYEKIARISHYDSNYAFRSAIADAGISDVLNEAYITELAEALMHYADNIQ